MSLAAIQIMPMDNYGSVDTYRIRKSGVRMLGHNPNKLQVIREAHVEQTTQDGVPKYAAPVYMFQRVNNVERKINVILKVYSSAFETYAVVTQNKFLAAAKDCGYFNLKSCSVYCDTDALFIQIVQNNGEGSGVKFKVANRDDLDNFMDALQPCTALNNRNNNDSCVFNSNGKETVSPKLGQLLKRDLSPRPPHAVHRKISLPALDESDEAEESDSEPEQ